MVMAWSKIRRLGLLVGILISACTPPTSQQSALLHPPYRSDVVPQWVALDWPKNDGCAAAPVSQTLAVGTLIDRFGNEYGSYFSPKGASFAARALPYVCAQTQYTVYRVTRPLHVATCKAVAWFGEPGGATQYKTDAPALKLRESGAIQPQPVDAGGSPCGDPTASR
jgi:hypothetical protein